MNSSSVSGGSGVTSSEEPAIPFPFEPYDVQKQLMSKIYATLDKGGIGIFESPTGTVRKAHILVGCIVARQEWRATAGKCGLN